MILLVCECLSSIHLCYMITYKMSQSEHQRQHLSQQQTEEAQQQQS
jgi:paired amphipathic helix protein Sin3a